MLQIEVLQDLLDPLRQGRDPIDHAEDAQVLPHRQIARQGGVDRREVGEGQRPAAADRQVQALDADAAGVRLQHPEDHVDGAGLAGAVWPDQADDLLAMHLERDRVGGDRAVIGLAQGLDGQHDLGRRVRTHRTCVERFASGRKRAGRRISRTGR